MDIVSTALGFIEQYGLIAIFILLVLDAALLLPVFPGEVVLVMAVATYATDISGLIQIIVLATAASLVGSLMLYGITRGGGRRLVERFPNFFMMPRRRRERMERLFAKPSGQTMVLFMRLLPLTRVLVSIPAGLARMPRVRFVVFSTIGLLLYHIGFLWFTYEARRPGSTVETQAEKLASAYANPAMQFIEANVVMTSSIVLALATVMAFRAYIVDLRHPDEPSAGLIATVTTLLLFWGGLIIGAITYLDPPTVYMLMRFAGVDEAILGSDPVKALLIMGGSAFAMGTVLRILRMQAKHKHQEWRRDQRLPPETWPPEDPVEARG